MNNDNLQIIFTQKQSRIKKDNSKKARSFTPISNFPDYKKACVYPESLRFPTSTSK